MLPFDFSRVTLRELHIDSRFFLNVALAVLGLGLAPLAKKAALTAGAGPLTVAVATATVAAVIAVSVVLRRLPAALTRYSIKTWLNVFVVGALGSGAVVLLAVIAMTDTTATNRSLFQSMYPVATAIAARLLLGERLPTSAYVTIVAMSFGLFMMNTGPEGLVIGLPFWLLLATLPMIGLADVYAKRTLADTPPGFVVAGRFAFGGLLLLGALPLTDADAWMAAAATWPWLVAAGVAMAAGVLGLYRAIDTAGASIGAAFVGTAPVITATAESLVLGAGFTPLQVMGLAVVVAGAVFLGWRV